MPEELELLEERRHRHSSHSKERQQKQEEEIANIAGNNLNMAREIVNLKKELNRLHYKTKHGFVDQRRFMLFLQVINAGLLAYIIYLLMR